MKSWLALGWVGILGGVVSAQEATVERVEGELAAYRSRPAARTAWVGPGTDDDAAAHYRVVQEQGLALSLAGFDRDALLRAVQEGETTPALDQLAARWSGVTRAARAAAAAGQCSWALDLEDGFHMEQPNLLSFRNAVAVLAYEAIAAPTAQEALDSAKVILGMGVDLQRLQNMLCVLMGASVQRDGLWVLEVLLTQRSFGGDTYLALTELLDRLPPVDLERMLGVERLGVEVSLLRIAGVEVDGQGLLQFEGADVPRSWEQLEPVLDEYRAHMDRVCEIAETEPREREELVDAFEAEASQHPDSVAWVMVPSPRFMGTLDELRVARRATRVLTAAHAYRVEEGAFPEQLDDLRELLGALPEDPYAPGAALILRRRGLWLQCYSVYQNGQDDGGVDPEAEEAVRRVAAWQAQDLAFTTRVPE